MDTKKLIQYLQQVRNLESLLYTQNLVISSLMRKAKTLGRERKIDEKRRYAIGIFEEHDLLAFLLPIVLGVLVAILLYNPFWQMIEADCIAPSGGYYYGISKGYITRKAIMLSTGFGIIAGGLVFVTLKIVNHINRKKRQKRCDTEYSKRFNKALKADNERMRQELAVRRTIIEQIQTVQAERDKTQTALHKLYSVNAIAEKYRGLVPVTMICEYLELGRCYGLHGHEGAYNLYENERRLDKIITQLEDIKRKLDQIKDNQYALYEIMSDANNTLARIERGNSNMLRSMKSIEKNAELIEFNTRSTATIARATGEFLIVKEFLK